MKPGDSRFKSKNGLVCCFGLVFCFALFWFSVLFCFVLFYYSTLHIEAVEFHRILWKIKVRLDSTLPVELEREKQTSPVTAEVSEPRTVRVWSYLLGSHHYILQGEVRFFYQTKLLKHTQSFGKLAICFSSLLSS